MQAVSLEPRFMHCHPPSKLIFVILVNLATSKPETNTWALRVRLCQLSGSGTWTRACAVLKSLQKPCQCHILTCNYRLKEHFTIFYHCMKMQDMQESQIAWRSGLEILGLFHSAFAWRLAVLWYCSSIWGFWHNWHKSQSSWIWNESQHRSIDTAKQDLPRMSLQCCRQTSGKGHPYCHTLRMSKAFS